MATTASLLTRLSTIFSSRRRSSLAGAQAPAEMAESGQGGTSRLSTSRLSLRILLLLIFAVALSPVLILGGVRWSSDIQKEAARRQETMLLVAGGAADRAETVLATAPALLDVINAVGHERTCSSDFAKLISNLPQFSNMAMVDADGRITCSAVDDRCELIGSRPRLVQGAARQGRSPMFSPPPYAAQPTRTGRLAAAKRLATADNAFDGALVIGVPISSLVYRLIGPVFRKTAKSRWSMMPGAFFRAATGRSSAATLSRNYRAWARGRAASSPPRQSTVVSARSRSCGCRRGVLYAMLSAPALPAIALENVNAFGNFALPLLSWLLALADGLDGDGLAGAAMA